jgi:hypothetical protein
MFTIQTFVSTNFFYSLFALNGNMVYCQSKSGSVELMGVCSKPVKNQRYCKEARWSVIWQPWSRMSVVWTPATPRAANRPCMHRKEGDMTMGEGPCPLAFIPCNSNPRFTTPFCGWVWKNALLQQKRISMQTQPQNRSANHKAKRKWTRTPKR